MAKRQEISPLVLDEYFAAQDERFLPALRAFHEPKKLASLADRWKRDFRPWARTTIFAYLDLPFDAAGHETVVKHLFKHAEEQRDDDLMAAFAVAFDRLVRRVRKTKHRYDFETRQSWQEEHLASPRNVLPHVGKQRLYQNPKTLEPVRAAVASGQGDLLFSYHTRYYLRRRAWRYFRRKGKQKPAEYSASVALMLRRYTDGYLGTGESLLDSWSLMHACFRGSDVLDFGPSKVNLKPGRALGELAAAPDFPELWKREAAARTLVDLLSAAQARAVRVWAIQLLRRDHMEHLGAFEPEEILALLDHADAEVQHFAAEMLERSPKLASLPLETWLKLLETRNPAALEIIARLMQQHVNPDQLTLDQMVDIAVAQPVPVARLGLSFLQGRPIESAEQRLAISRLATARSAGVAGEITAWALSILGPAEHYDVDLVCRFFDSLQESARAAAWSWLMAAAAGAAASRRGVAARAGGTGEVSSLRDNAAVAPAHSPAAVSAGYNDPALWSRLIETPYDDVRFNVVRELERRAKLPGTSVQQVTVVWTSVLLGINRGGRSKLTALRQISRAIEADPAHAEPLLPVLAVAIRSVRMPEVRTGLSAVVTAVEAHPPLAAAVARHLPELELPAEVAV